MNDANTYASAFEAFITEHPIVMCIALAWVVSWVVTVTVRPFIKALLPDHIERHFVRLFDVLLAGAAALVMWPEEHGVIWAMAIGGSSPIAYFALSEAVCWKWPQFRKYLSLRDLSPDVLTDETGDDDGAVPPKE